MPELILPGVYIEVRPEGLIVGGPVSIRNIGIVGTAARGPVGEVKILSSLDDARNTFGLPDPLDAPTTPGFPLTLVRALKLAYQNGASTVMAVRTVKTTAAAGAGNNPIPGTQLFTTATAATHVLATASGGQIALTATGPGTWANQVGAKKGVTVKVENAPSNSVKVSIAYGAIAEGYVVRDGTNLVNRINGSSVLVQAAATGDVSGLPASPVVEVSLAGGVDADDATPADYDSVGFQALLKADAQIIVAAGLDDTEIGTLLRVHVEQASNDTYKRERIGVVGSTFDAKMSDLQSFGSPSDRIVFVGKGIVTTDDAGNPVTLAGAYAAAAIAGMISARDPQVSITNKTVSVDKLQTMFNSGELEQLVEANVLALEDRGNKGLRVVKGITTDTSGAFSQITTRRIVDYAKNVVRAAADPYIGLLNNDRVRKALKASINGALALMVDDEQLENYALEVSATRDEEIRGIAKVVMTLQPTFSIDYIKVTMYLG